MTLRDRKPSSKPSTSQAIVALEEKMATIQHQLFERFELLQVGPQQEADKKTAREAPSFAREYELITLPFRGWDPGAVLAAKAQADEGDLERAADLWESALSDERVAASMEQRINGLEGLPVRFTGDGEDVLGAISTDFWQMMKPGDRAAMRRWGLGVGICPVYVSEWIENADGRQVPICEVWNPRFLRWRQGDKLGKREWWIQTATSQIKISDQPGRWFLFTPFSGANQRPWVDGIWYSVATWWLAKSFGIADLASFSQSHATPKWFLMPKEGAQIGKEEKAEAIRRLAALPQRSGMYVPAGFSVEQKEATSTAWNAITSLIDLANKALTIRIIGTDSTTDKESSYASTAGGMQLLWSKFRTDADAESSFWHDGPLQFWSLLNFRGTRKLQDRRVLDLEADPITGVYRLLDESERRQPRKSEYGQRLRQLSEQIRGGDEVPWPTRDATPPQDMAAVAETQFKAAGTLVQLGAAAASNPEFAKAISKMDVPRYLERYFPMQANDESGAQLQDRRLLLETPTDFPTQGDNKAVSLRNSGYAVFDPAYAADIKANWPEIWNAGGNDVEGTEHSGNDQYRRLLPVVDRGGKPETDTEEEAIRRREAWAARHNGNNRLAGIVALMKWFVVGEVGERGMKEVIEERKDMIKLQSKMPDGVVPMQLEDGTILELAAKAVSGGRWVTISGRHVLIPGGAKGPLKVGKGGKITVGGKPVGGGDATGKTAARPEVTATIKRNGRVLSGKDAEAHREAVVKDVLGKNADDDTVLGVLGLDFSGAKAQVNVMDDTVEVKIDHPDFYMHRTFMRGEDGARVCYNDEFVLKGEKGTGKGTQILKDQMDGLRQNGFDRMETSATRDIVENGVQKSYNGYYTWARLGYDAKIPSRLRDELPDSLDYDTHRNVSDLMKSKEGRDWWKKNGQTIQMSFDLSKDSANSQIFDAYMREKGK